MGSLDGDEVDSFYELIGAIFLMLFCAMAIGFMGAKMSSMINRYHHRDKIETTANAADVNYIFNYTGYQAYMFAWMMDPYSDVGITWMTNTSARVDGSDTDHVTLCTLDSNGNVINNFIPYRNQIITGGHISPVTNVKNVIRNVHLSQVDALFAHDGVKCDHVFQLLYTNEYTTKSDPYFASDGTTIYDERKANSWIILPK